jgi:putative ATP-dependent endonuclease of OLD family
MPKKSTTLAKEESSSQVTNPVDATIRNSGIQITDVRILNFRCLRAVEISLGLTTLLIGENNAGKTSFLEAFHAAIGSGIRQFSEDDLWADLKEKQPPRDRSIIVDLLIRPVNQDGAVESVFP